MVTRPHPLIAAARVAWAGLTLLVAALYVAGIPGLYSSLRTLSLYGPRERGSVREALAEAGVSTGHYASYLTALGVLITATCFAVALVIFIKRSSDPTALFVAAVLVLLGATFPGTIEKVGEASPALLWLSNTLNGLSLASVLLLIYIFPDGRFAPRWTMVPGLLFAAFIFITSTLPDTALNPGYGAPAYYAAFTAGVLVIGVYSQFYRYRRAASPIQRQQIKWVISGFAAALAGYFGILMLPLLSPSLRPGTVADIVASTAAVGFMLLIPLSIGVAMLRYRLWDIDHLINRTLVYTTVTVLLGTVYLGATIGLQRVFVALTDQESRIAIVVSTLAIAVLFHPLRRRVQNIVDRGFYRERHDTAIALREFSSRLQRETELEAVGTELISAVHYTLHPDHASLWLRPLKAGQARLGSNDLHGRENKGV